MHTKRARLTSTADCGLPTAEAARLQLARVPEHDCTPEWNQRVAREVAAQRERMRARTADQCALCGQSGKELHALPVPHCVHPTTCESCTARLTRRIEKDPAVAVELLRMCQVCSAPRVSS